MKNYLAMLGRYGLLLLVASCTMAVLLRGVDRSLTPAAPVASLTSAVDSTPNETHASESAPNKNPASETHASESQSKSEGSSESTLGQAESMGQAESTSLSSFVRGIDGEFRRHWAKEQLQHAEPANWLTVCRRLSLALVGTGMSLEEIRSLEKLPEHERVAAHRERLLADKRFADYWGERLARAFVGAEEGPFLVFRRRKFNTWLSEQLQSNQPYDRIVRQLVTGRGYFTDRPEVNFHTVTMNSGEEGQPDPILLAGRTSRAFLGMRIDCLQCHDDFLGNVRLGSSSEPREGTQHDFHQLASFYSDARFNPFQGIRTETHPYRYKYLYDDQDTEVEASVPFAAELLPEGGTKAERLATWLTDPNNRPTARAIANRVWALMFGRALNVPVDDIPLHGPLPPALDQLADAVVATNWDLRQLIRIIAELEVFKIDSRADFEITDRHDQNWAVFPLVQLRPEQVARSVVQASRLTTIDDSAAFVMKLIAFGSETDFVQRYGDMGEDEFNQDSVTVTQRLLMMNGKMVRERIEANPVLNATSHIDMFASSNRSAIESVYLAVLNRWPTPAELQHYEGRIQESGQRVVVLEDLFWVLMNASELAWNH